MPAPPVFLPRSRRPPVERERRECLATFGQFWTARPPQERAEIELGLDRLRRLGYSLRSAAETLERIGRVPPAAPLETAARDFLTAKAAQGLRPRSQRKLRASIDRFLANRREVPIAETTPAPIREFPACNGWWPRCDYLRQFVTRSGRSLRGSL